MVVLCVVGEDCLLFIYFWEKNLGMTLEVLDVVLTWLGAVSTWLTLHIIYV